jgi:hypothetical protein
MQWFNSDRTRSKLATDVAAQFAAAGNRPKSPFPRSVIFDDVSQAIAKARQQACDMI